MKVLVSTTGSSGDLFPLVPVMAQLQEAGHEVCCAVPRVLGYSLRAAGVPTFALGDGSEMRIFDDASSTSSRFDGWGSVRTQVVTFVGASLAADVASIEQLIGTWRPDVIVASTNAPSARIAAFRQGVPRVSLTLYPSILSRLERSTAFAAPFRAACAEQAGLPADGGSRGLVDELAWGMGAGTVILHDRALLARSELADDALGSPGSLGVTPRSWDDAVGFTYWDRGLTRQAELEGVRDWINRSDEPFVLVTMGSYLGARRGDVWDEVTAAVMERGVRGLFLGPRRALQQRVAGHGDRLLAAGFVPLSWVFDQGGDRVAAMTHHGGIGTMFAALRAGVPSLVTPLAFDQPFNARLVERLGAGVRVRPGTVRDALARVLEDTCFAEATGAVGSSLVATDVAAKAASERIVAAARAAAAS